MLKLKHEPDKDLPIPGASIKHSDPQRTPYKLAVCKHCRTVFAGELDEFGSPEAGGICPARLGAD